MKKYLLTLFNSLLLGSVLWASVPQLEKQALIDLYESTKGASWNQTWNLSQDVVLWEGVTISDGHITEIRMLFNNLNGELPSSLGNLSKLKVLELSFNKISGLLPTELGKLTELEVLALNGNFISGSIPSSIGELHNLKQLHLSSNQLTGSVPVSINTLTELEVFNVFQNELSGKVPVELSKSRNIREFVIAENNFIHTKEVSQILLSRSAQMNVFGHNSNPNSKQIIAIETEEEN